MLCATNHPEIIDTALLRRFQLRINFEMPTQQVLDEYYNQLLSRFPTVLQNIERKYNISFAEAKDHTFTSVKSILIKELEAREKSTEV